MMQRLQKRSSKQPVQLSTLRKFVSPALDRVIRLRVAIYPPYNHAFGLWILRTGDWRATLIIELDMKSPGQLCSGLLFFARDFFAGGSGGDRVGMVQPVIRQVCCGRGAQIRNRRLSHPEV